MTRLVRPAGGFVLVFGLFGCAGCSSGPPPIKMIPVNGTVSLDGKLLDEGTVYFKTQETGAFEQLPIKGGKFEGNAGEGQRRVEITAYRTKVLDLNGMKGEMKESLIADRYNVNSTLTATVTSAGPNTFNFDVKSK